ncbi:MAG TPA: hypothetical protein VFB12_16070 [Ktedonobacteraceae bacterium]|nr:hypothetical protein [Ktedonobacteraceae bacterium]
MHHNQDDPITSNGAIPVEAIENSSFSSKHQSPDILPAIQN